MDIKDSEITISVVIPAFNEERYLGACLRSLQAQDVKERWEVIVADNGSTDATSRIARQYGARVVFESRRGICFARRAGTLEAQGRIIVSTDADCVFPVDWLRKIHQTFVSTPELVGMAGPILFERKPLWGRAWSRTVFWAVNVYYQIFHRVFYISACNFAFTKSAWESAGGYNTQLAQGGDEYDLLYRLRSCGPVLFLNANTVLTSSRRLERGLLYNFFVTMCYYYLFDYFILSRLTGRTVAGVYPEFRGEAKPVFSLWTKVAVGVVAVAAFVFLVAEFPEFAKAQVPKPSLSTRIVMVGEKTKQDIAYLHGRVDTCIGHLGTCAGTAAGHMAHFTKHWHR